LLMMKSYLKIAWRNLLRHKAFSLINILGLSIGIATCTIMFLYVQHELTYDQYNKRSSRIVRVTANLHSPENDLRLATAPALLAPSLKRNLPEIEEAVRIQEESVAIKWQDRLYQENDFCKSDQSIFSIFDFVFIEGSPVNALKAPNSIVINRSVARKSVNQQRWVKYLSATTNPYWLLACSKTGQKILILKYLL